MELLFNAPYKHKNKFNRDIVFTKVNNKIWYQFVGGMPPRPWSLSITPIQWLSEQSYHITLFHSDPIINKIRALKSRRKQYYSSCMSDMGSQHEPHI